MIGVGEREIVVSGVDVDEFDVEVGVGAAGGDVEMRREWSGDGDIFGERIAHVGEDVGTLGSEALIAEHVFLWESGGGVGDEGYGMRGIADVFVIGGFLGGRR